jgi:two-component system sensor histidine kinase/response regulator
MHACQSGTPFTMKTLIYKLLARLESWRVGSKLLMGIGSGLALALFMGLMGIYAVRALNASTQQTYNIDLAAVAHLHDAETNHLMVGLYLRQMAITSAEVQRVAARKALDAANSRVRQDMQEVRKHMPGTHARHMLEDFDTAYVGYDSLLVKVLALLAKQDSYSDGEAISLITSDEFKKISDRVTTVLAEIVRLMTEDVAASAERINRLAASTERWMWILVLLSLAGGVVGGLLITRSIRDPLNDLRDSIENIAAGAMDGVVPHTSQGNEIGAIAKSLQVLQHSAQAQDAQRWIKANMVAMTTSLQGIDSIAVLARQLMVRLTPLTGAQVGVFFYFDRKTQRFNLMGSHGYKMRKNFNQHFGIGEGIVGQCAAEGAPILLSDLPHDYMHISSALGEAPPRFVLAAPVTLPNGSIAAVVELGFLTRPGQREQTLCEEVLPLIGVSISILENNLRTQHE